MDPPPQASLFHRPREQAALLLGQEKLVGRRSLELPAHVRLIGLEFHGLPSNACPGSQLRLELMPCAEPGLRIQVLLTNVGELSLPHLPAEGLEISFFDIEDIQANGWPGVNWRVGEIVSKMPDPTTGAPLAPLFQCYAEQAQIVSVSLDG